MIPPTPKATTTLLFLLLLTFLQLTTSTAQDHQHNYQHQHQQRSPSPLYFYRAPTGGHPPPPTPPTGRHVSPTPHQKRTTTVSNSQPLVDLRCLQSPPPRDPYYFFDLFLEDVRNWVCIDHAQRKTFYHGKDRFVVQNDSGERRCIKKKVLTGYVKILWEMAMKTCERSGAMGKEDGVPDVAVYLFGGAAGL
ncbi:hypothetical protein DFH27DRAFT_609251 [Peziza echinospora]|nr:hypothetical protein DFH27DRAFT_609251 [Peziza echinospora]